MAYRINGTKRTTLLTWDWLWYDIDGGEKWSSSTFLQPWTKKDINILWSCRHNDQRPKNCWLECNYRRTTCKIEFGNSSGTLRFLQVFLDDFNVYGDKNNHLQQ